MIEVFKYTERVVNMARPRKVLMMAIGRPAVHVQSSVLTCYFQMGWLLEPK